MKQLILSPKDDLQAAFDSLTEPTEILLKAGIYRQKLKLTADNVVLRGEDRKKTVLTFGDYARKIHTDGREYNTFRTYTLCVTGENVRLETLTVENSESDPASHGQCVALSVHAKTFSAKDVDLVSTQDTLFCAPFPDDLVVRYLDFLPRDERYLEGEALHCFEHCRISGTVDFIFGCAEARFLHCEIVSRSDGRDRGFVAAPAHSLKQTRGFLFVDCDFLGEGCGENSVFLARPWRDFGKCVFLDCRLAKHISPLLFDRWNDTERDRTARFLYRNLTGIPLSPVPWARELSEAEADAERR